MWTTESRAFVGDLGAGQALSDDQHALLAPLIPPAKPAGRPGAPARRRLACPAPPPPRARPGGRPRTADMRRLLDGLFYLVRTGCQWRHLPPPPAFPPWRPVPGSLRALLHARACQSLPHHFVVMLREGAGRDASPS